MALTRGIGKLIQIGVAKETVRGTPQASATFWLATDDWDIAEKYNNVIQSESYGLIEDSVGALRVKNWAEGQISMPVMGTTAGIILQSIFGSSNAVAHSGETKVYDHMFDVKQIAQHASLTFFVHDPIATPSGATADYTHANAVVHKLDIEYQLGKQVYMTASIKALAGSAAAVVFSPSIVDQVYEAFLPQDLTFKVAPTFSGIAGATAIKIKSAKISIDENIEDDDVLGSTSPRDFLNKEFKIEGQLEAIWQNEADFKTNALSNNAQAMQLDLVNTDVKLGVVPTSPELILKLYKVFFTEFSRPIKLKDTVYQTVKFKATYDTTNAVMARAILTNGYASAY